MTNDLATTFVVNEEMQVRYFRDLGAIHRRLSEFLRSQYAWWYWHSIGKVGLSFRYRCQRDQSPMTFLTMSFLSKFGRIRKFILIILERINFAINYHWIYKALSTQKSEQKSKVLYIDVGGQLSLTPYLTRFCEKYQIDFYVQFENWDNLSSKAVFGSTLPILMTWGPQSREFALRLHGFPRDKVFIVGSPRVSFEKEHLSRLVPRDTILFAGGSLNFEREIEFLLEFAKLVNTSRQHIALKLVYLPHPKRLFLVKEVFEEISEKSVEVWRLAETLRSERSEWKLPALTDYKALFGECRALVSPMSTMNLEALCLGIPSIAIDEEIKDKRITKFTDNIFVSDVHDHLKELKENSCVKFITDLKEVSLVVDQIISNKSLSAHTSIGCRCSEYFVHTSIPCHRNIVAILNQVI